MTLQEMMEVRALRIEQMVAKLGLRIAPDTDAATALRSTKVLKTCADCTDGLRCRNFTNSEGKAEAAPSFCLNKELFDALLDEFGADFAPFDRAEVEVAFGGWMAGSKLFGGFGQPAPLPTTELPLTPAKG